MNIILIRDLALLVIGIGLGGLLSMAFGWVMMRRPIRQPKHCGHRRNRGGES